MKMFLKKTSGPNSFTGEFYQILCAWEQSRFSHAQLFATLRTVPHQASLPMGLSKQEYWSGLPCLTPGDLPHLTGIELQPLKSPAMAGRFFTTSATWEA